jgi:hypothetical protein
MNIKPIAVIQIQNGTKINIITVPIPIKKYEINLLYL